MEIYYTFEEFKENYNKDLKDFLNDYPDATEREFIEFIKPKYGSFAKEKHSKRRKVIAEKWDLKGNKEKVFLPKGMLFLKDYQEEDNIVTVFCGDEKDKEEAFKWITDGCDDNVSVRFIEYHYDKAVKIIKEEYKNKIQSDLCKLLDSIDKGIPLADFLTRIEKVCGSIEEFRGRKTKGSINTEKWDLKNKHRDRCFEIENTEDLFNANENTIFICGLNEMDLKIKSKIKSYIESKNIDYVCFIDNTNVVFSETIKDVKYTTFNNNYIKMSCELDNVFNNLIYSERRIIEFINDRLTQLENEETATPQQLPPVEPLREFKDTTNQDKIIILKELGVIDYLKERLYNPDNISSLSEVLSAITGIKSKTLNTYINPIINKNSDQKNNPYNVEANVIKANEKLDKLKIHRK